MGIILNFLLLLLSTAGALVAIGGDTWKHGNLPWKQRITRRGWVAIFCMLAALIIGGLKEIQNDAEALNAKRNQQELQTKLAELNAELVRSNLKVQTTLDKLADAVRTPVIEKARPAVHQAQDMYKYRYSWDGNACAGFFGRKTDGRWLEHTSNEGGCLETAYLFEETSRTDSYINLFDSTRGYYIRLPLDGGGWAQLATAADGPWANLHQVEQLQ